MFVCHFKATVVLIATFNPALIPGLGRCSLLLPASIRFKCSCRSHICTHIPCKACSDLIQIAWLQLCPASGYVATNRLCTQLTEPLAVHPVPPSIHPSIHLAWLMDVTQRADSLGLTACYPSINRRRAGRPCSASTHCPRQSIKQGQVASQGVRAGGILREEGTHAHLTTSATTPTYCIASIVSLCPTGS